MSNNTSESIIGHVAEIWRYPVKSLRGESCPETKIDHRGLQFDRLYALVDEAGKFGSHKNTRRFARMDNLYQMQSQLANGQAGIVFPDGQHLAVDHPDIAGRVSRIVGQPVTVRAEQQIPHQDMGAIHLLTTASLRWLQQLLPGAKLGAERFRPNFVLDVEGIGPVEQSWVGHALQIGTAKLMVVEPAERCVMTTLSVGALPADPVILRTLGQRADALFGVYARVIEPGSVALQDPVAKTVSGTN